MNYLTKVETLVLNIGLGIKGEKGNTHFTNVFEVEKSGLFVLSENLHIDGQYLGEKEVTSEIQVIKTGDWKNTLSKLCATLQQECIAVYEPFRQEGCIVYNPNYSGEKITFDWNYFILTNLSPHTLSTK